jgi:O-antigen ligase
MTSQIILEQRQHFVKLPFVRTSAMEQILVFGPFALLLFGPLAFGAVSPLPIFVLEAGSALLFLLWMIHQAKSGELSFQWNPVFAPMLAFAGIVGLQLLSGQTAYRQATYSSAMLYIAYGLLCFLITQMLRQTYHLRTLAVTASIYGFAIAIFAVLQSVSSDEKLYWVHIPRNGGWIYGPYVNHNHYAGLMEMLIPIPLVIGLSHLANRTMQRLAMISAAIMAATIFLSGSRGGMIAFLVQLSVLAFFAIRRTGRFRVNWMAGLFPIILVCLLMWLGGSEFTNRVSTIHTEMRSELSGGMRMNIVRDGLKMFRQKPILGYGLGTFSDVYPRFRSFYSEVWINEAHNDYIQLLVETGALGFVAMLWFFWTTYSEAAKKISNWTDDRDGTLALIALLGCTGILVHSLVDFNLQIPANAAIFYVLCTLAAMEPRFRQTPTRTSSFSPSV